MLLKQKICDKIKGQTVAGENKQRYYISKEDPKSPTVAIESGLISYIIYTKKESDVSVINIPNIFIQMWIEHEKDVAITKLRWVLVDMLLYIAPGVYGPYVTTDRKLIKELITPCMNAISVCL